MEPIRFRRVRDGGSGVGLIQTSSGKPIAHVVWEDDEPKKYIVAELESYGVEVVGPVAVQPEFNAEPDGSISSDGVVIQAPAASGIEVGQSVEIFGGDGPQSEVEQTEPNKLPEEPSLSFSPNDKVVDDPNPVIIEPAAIVIGNLES